MTHNLIFRSSRSLAWPLQLVSVWQSSVPNAGQPPGSDTATTTTTATVQEQLVQHPRDSASGNALPERLPATPDRTQVRLAELSARHCGDTSAAAAAAAVQHVRQLSREYSNTAVEHSIGNNGEGE